VLSDPVIHDFCLFPPKTVFKVEFDVTISLAERTWLSGGRRIFQSRYMGEHE
jgi:hypothetical protein